MPNVRLTMRNIRDILRLRLAAGLSFRQISRSTKVSIGAIQKLGSRELIDQTRLIPPKKLSEFSIAAV